MRCSDRNVVAADVTVAEHTAWKQMASDHVSKVNAYTGSVTAHDVNYWNDISAGPPKPKPWCEEYLNEENAWVQKYATEDCTVDETECHGFCKSHYDMIKRDACDYDGICDIDVEKYLGLTIDSCGVQCREGGNFESLD